MGKGSSRSDLVFSISSPPASPVRLALHGRRAGLRESNGGQVEIENANQKIPKIQ